MDVPYVGLQDGIIPNARATDKDEERRLFYVGITRAMDELVLSWCEVRYGNRVRHTRHFEAGLKIPHALSLRRGRETVPPHACGSGA
jgi:superfamily I DNA/RNA helicase